MQFSNYKYWVHALRNNRGMKNLIIDIIHTAEHYKIDGIQFSNLHPTRVWINIFVYYKSLKFDLKFIVNETIKNTRQFEVPRSAIRNVFLTILSVIINNYYLTFVNIFRLLFPITIELL